MLSRGTNEILPCVKPHKTQTQHYLGEAIVDTIQNNFFFIMSFDTTSHILNKYNKARSFYILGPNLFILYIGKRVKHKS